MLAPAACLLNLNRRNVLGIFGLLYSKIEPLPAFVVLPLKATLVHFCDFDGVDVDRKQAFLGFLFRVEADSQLRDWVLVHLLKHLDHHQLLGVFALLGVLALLLDETVLGQLLSFQVKRIGELAYLLRALSFSPDVGGAAIVYMGKRPRP